MTERLGLVRCQIFFFEDADEPHVDNKTGKYSEKLQITIADIRRELVENIGGIDNEVKQKENKEEEGERNMTAGLI